MKRRSPWFFMIAVALLMFVGLSIILFKNFLTLIRHDASTINNLGVIRGSIQRFSKLELIGQNNDEIRKTIDDLISQYKKRNIIYLGSLEQNWNQLKEITDYYRDNPSEKNRERFIEKSEECWLLSNQMLLENQIVSENKLRYLTLPILLLVIDFVIVFVMMYFAKRYVHDNLEVSALYDPLTKVFNRRYFFEYLSNEIIRSERKNTVFSLVMFDIDFFKNVNDTYGHIVGDEVLKTVTGIVQKYLRKYDVLARYGGEEFIVLLHDTNLKEAEATSERARIGIEEYHFKDIGNLTVSLGVTVYNEGDTADDMLKRADAALYLAKNNGRNRTEVV